MKSQKAIAVVGTFDSKGEEHLFLKERIQARGFATITIHVGTKGPSSFTPDHDLYSKLIGKAGSTLGRDECIGRVLSGAQQLVLRLYQEGNLAGVISAGGGTGTHLGAGIMHVLPLGVPKVMVSTVASRNMSEIVSTKDITMMHSVADILGINSILGRILDRAAGAVCGMAESQWKPGEEKPRIALTMFGFITEAAENIKACLEEKGYEVVAFHANGKGGMAMEELAKEGYFQAILDLATHELADTMMGGYCSGAGPQRLEPVPGRRLPRLVIPGGLDCAVLEFTRDNVPEKYRHRKVFFYDFRSAIGLERTETLLLAGQLREKLNKDPLNTRMLIPNLGWSEADREGGPLYDPEMRKVFVEELRKGLDPSVEIQEAEVHINDISFARLASSIMSEMLDSTSTLT